MNGEQDPCLSLLATSVGSRYMTRTRQVSDGFRNGRARSKAKALEGEFL